MKPSSCLLFLTVFLASLTGCKTDYANLPTYAPNRQLQAVIETPAGSAHKLQYDQATKEFIADEEAGQARVIGFLPFPGNFGFIPSTQTNSKGKGLEILVIGESVATGTVMEVIPIALLQLEAAGNTDHKIIAIPARPSEQLITANSFAELSNRYPAALEILQKWFTSYNPTERSRFVRWHDEQFADQEIQRWMKL